MKDYTNKTIGYLKGKAQSTFNAWIRVRDAELPCISCGRHSTLQAGHFYSSGHFKSLSFNEDNVHGQCVRCNHFLSGNLIQYRESLIKKIGIERVKKLDYLSKQRGANKLNRFYLIEIIENYEQH